MLYNDLQNLQECAQYWTGVVPLLIEVADIADTDILQFTLLYMVHTVSNTDLDVSMLYTLTI